MPHNFNLYSVTDALNDMASCHVHTAIAQVFRRDRPPTRSRRSEGSGEESCSMLTSVEGHVVQGRKLL
jgi:hypothetical protein